jgi:predicted TIM-barrel fold metal-dependent hydrolase
VGEDRLLWGSDWPWTNHEAPVRMDECRMLATWPGRSSPGEGEQNEGEEEGGMLSDALRWHNAAALYGFAVKA